MGVSAVIIGSQKRSAREATRKELLGNLNLLSISVSYDGATLNNGRKCCTVLDSDATQHHLYVLKIDILEV